MADYTLILGNKNYSSWSMRGWLTLTEAGRQFDEVVVPLFRDDTAARLANLSHAPPLVPVLLHGERTIWDSYAILEYINEQHPQAELWPADPGARAIARSICAEMHSGFLALRGEVPMNIRARRGRELSDQAWRDIRRIETIWSDCLGASGGPFLFGQFSAADIYFAPVVTRFRTIEYQNGDLQGYCDRILNRPSVKSWCKSGQDEPWVIEASA